jgi:hypothetical protein
MISKNNKAIVEANNKGYLVIDEKVFYKDKEVKINIKKTGYYGFSIRLKNGERYIIMVHRLIAYQKFGDKIFKNNIQVRHLDCNCLNNKNDNISIGTSKDNNNDKKPSIRIKASLYATSFIKKYNHEDIIKLHNEGIPYKKIMELYNIKSKGTISFIIKKSIESKKNMRK